MLIKFWKLLCKSLNALELPVELVVILSVVVVMVSVSPVVVPGVVLAVEAGVVLAVELGVVLVVEAGVVLVVVLGVELVAALGAALELAADNCCKRFCRSDTRFEPLIRPLPLPPLLSPSESVLPLFEDPA